MTGIGTTQTFDPRALGPEGESLLRFMDIVEGEVRRQLADLGGNEVQITWRTGRGEAITVIGESEA